MAKDEKVRQGNRDEVIDLEYIKKRLDALDERLDNIDSIVTVVTERVMKQPLTITITCPRCGNPVDISIMGVEKPRR